MSDCVRYLFKEYALQIIRFFVIMSFKRKVFDIIEPGRSPLSRQFDLLIIGLICLNVAAIVVESFKGLSQSVQNGLYYFEVFSVGVFTLEYLLRFWTAGFKYPDKSWAGARLAFVFSALSLIDLLAIMPFYLPLLITVDMRFVRVLRLLRIARLLKLNRYSRALQVIGDVFKEKRADLGITMFITFLLLLIASTIMYYLEGQEQPEAFPNIPATLWWAVATLTTVGYGDVYPITDWGRFVSGIIALLGIGMVALPTGILSAAYMDKMQEKKDHEKQEQGRCPHCGESLNEHPPHPEPVSRETLTEN